jgi:hypothetical protein
MQTTWLATLGVLMASIRRTILRRFHDTMSGLWSDLQIYIADHDNFPEARQTSRDQKVKSILYGNPNVGKPTMEYGHRSMKMRLVQIGP